MNHAHERQGSCLVIRPNRSLSVGGMVALFAAFGVWTLAVGAGFAFMGLWMILPFALLDILIVGLLCLWFYRHRDDCELVTVDAERVHITKRRGDVVSHCHFPRHWSRVRVDRSYTPHGRCKLLVGSHGRFVSLGEELNDADRVVAAQELQQLLRSHA